MKTYTESELQWMRHITNAVNSIVNHLRVHHKIENWTAFNEISNAIKVLPTEDKEDDVASQMSSFLNSEGEDDYGLYEEDVKNDAKIIYETYKTMIDCPLKEHLRKWFDFVPSDNKNEGAFVVSHSCTSGNSIEQQIADYIEKYRNEYAMTSNRIARNVIKLIQK